MDAAAVIDIKPDSKVSAGDDAPSSMIISGSKHRYILVILFLTYTLSFLDRQVITILAEYIKRDLHISNFQLGMLTGLTFAVFYTFLGIPIAGLAERRSRPAIIAVSMALWSGFTVLSGRAGSFLVMAIARLGVGFGEAGCNPSAHSMIADITPLEKRGSALAFYSLGVTVGSILGAVMGGAIADSFGWRAAFYVAGAPGLVLALAVVLTVKEPRSRLLAAAASRPKPPSFGQTLKLLADKPTFWLLALAAGLLSLVGYGHAAFAAPFMLRVHGVEIAQLAHRFHLGPLTFLALAGTATAGVGALIGTTLGGVLAAAAGKRDRRALMRVPAAAAFLAFPIIFLLYTVKSAVLCLALGVFPNMLGTLWYGPGYATAQSVVASPSRPTAAAILLFVINLIGLGLGPITVGALNDLLAGPQFGLGQAEGVRWAMILSASVGLVAGVLFWLARRTIRRDLVD